MLQQHVRIIRQNKYWNKTNFSWCMREQCVSWHSGVLQRISPSFKQEHLPAEITLRCETREESISTCLYYMRQVGRSSSTSTCKELMQFHFPMESKFSTLWLENHQDGVHLHRHGVISSLQATLATPEKSKCIVIGAISLGMSKGWTKWQGSKVYLVVSSEFYESVRLKYSHTWFPSHGIPLLLCVSDNMDKATSFYLMHLLLL